MVPAQGDGRAPARAVPQVQGAVRHGSDGHHLPGRPPARRGGHADPSRARQDPRRRRAPPAASPSDPDGTIVIDSPDGAGASGLGAPDDPDDPSALAGLLPSEMASRCVALGERVAALREGPVRSPPRRTPRRRAREAEDAAAAAELATEGADALREELARTKHDLQMAIHQRDAPPSPNERARPRLCARRRSSASARTNCSAFAGRSRRSRRSVNSSATSRRDACRRETISSVGFEAKSPPTRDARWRRSVAASREKTGNCISRWRSTTSWRGGCARRNARSPPRSASRSGDGSEARRGGFEEGEGKGNVRVRGNGERGRGRAGLARRTRRARVGPRRRRRVGPEGASSLFPRAKSTKTATKATKRARRDDAATNLTNLTNVTVSVSATRETPSGSRGSRRRPRAGRSVAPRPRGERVRSRSRVPGPSFGIVGERRRFGSDGRRGGPGGGSSGRHPRGYRRGACREDGPGGERENEREREIERTGTPPPPPPPPRLGRLLFGFRPGRRRSRGAASEAASGTTRARVRIRGGRARREIRHSRRRRSRRSRKVVRPGGLRAVARGVAVAVAERAVPIDRFLERRAAG